MTDLRFTALAPEVDGYGAPIDGPLHYNAHLCPVPGCTRFVSDGQVACRDHWCGIPRSKRHLLIQAFRQREENPTLYEQACTLARQLAIEHAALRDARKCRTSGAA